VLRKIGVDYQNNDSSIEELRTDDSLGYAGLLLTVCIFSNPLDECKNRLPEHHIYDDDDECN